MMADSSNIASGTLGTVDWHIDSSGVLHLGAGTLPDNTPSTTGYANDLISPWNTYASKIISISFDEKIVAPSYIAGYFAKLPSCTSLVKPENVDASKITDASNLFYNSGFTEIDLSSWNLSSLTKAEATFSTNDNLTKVLFPEMPKLSEIQFLFYYDRKLKETNIDKLELPVLSQANYTFFNCSSLTIIDTSRWNMSGVDNVSHMFEGCSSLTSVDTSNWNANFVTMDTMFSGCSSLKSLDVSTWNVSEATSFNMLFANCSLLETLIGVDKWDTSNITDMAKLFTNCRRLYSFDVGSWNVSKVTNMWQTFNGVSADNSSLKSLDLSKWKTTSLTTTYLTFSSMNKVQSINITGWDTSKVTNMRQMFGWDWALTEIKGLEDLDVSNVTDMSSMFYRCFALPSLNLSKWSTNSLTKMNGITTEMSALTSVDFTDWDTSKVSDFNSIFSGDDHLSDIKGVSDWDMRKATNIAYMFMNCKALTYFDVSKWRFENLTSLNHAFYSCNNLKELDVSNWDMSKVTTLQQTFDTCYLLILKGYENWDTSSLTRLDWTFSNCKSMVTFDVSNWKTNNLTILTGTFANEDKLKEVIGLKNWNVSKVTSTAYMFFHDPKLERVDMQGWKLENNWKFFEMFLNCVSIKFLDISDFQMQAGADYTNMLQNVSPYVIGLNKTMQMEPTSATDNHTGFISSSLSTSDLNGYRYYKYIQGGNASNVPIEGQNIVRNSDFSKGFTGFVKNLGSNAKGIVDIQKDTDGTNMVHMQYPDNATGIVGIYTQSHRYGNNNPTTTHEINKGDIYTAIARVKGKGDIVWFGYEDVNNYLYEHVDYPDWTWISRTAVSPSHDDPMELTINQGELYVKNFAIFHGSTAYPYIKAPEDIYSMSPTNVAGGADLIHIYKEGSNSRLTSYWVRTGTTIAKDIKGNILSSTPNQIYDISSKPYPLYYTIPPVFKGYRLVGTQSGSKPVGMLDPNNMNVTYLYEPILDPSVNDLTKTTAVVNQGIRSVSYTKGNTKVTKSPDVANTLNLDDIIKDSGRTIPNE